MKIAILTSRYPSEKNHYAHTFVHRRSKYFSEKGHDVVVFVPSKEKYCYEFEGVRVSCMPANEISKMVIEFDLAYFHLLNIYPQPALNGFVIYKKVISCGVDVAFYIHGSEVQTLASRNFDFRITPKEIARVIYKDIYFMPQMRWVVRKLIEGKSLFLTPSHWMLNEAKKELKINELEAVIVPNGIDTDLFAPSLSPVDNKKMLCIRPLNSNKYAVDVAIDVMKFLPEEFTLDIYGKGPKVDEYRKLIENNSLENRVSILEEFIPNTKMPEVINRYTYYLSPTRMDAQGVSMCEALACGALIATSNNTAIPEFVQDAFNGVVGDNAMNIAQKIIELDEQPEKRALIRSNARKSMLGISNAEVLQKEITLLEEFTK